MDDTWLRWLVCLIALVGVFTALSEVLFWLFDALVYLVTASKNLDLTGDAGLIAAVRAREGMPG